MTVNNGGSGLAAAALPPATVATFGASIEQNEGAAVPLGGPYPAVSYANGLGVIQWANAFSDGKLQLVLNAALAGVTSQQMLANMQNPASSQYALGLNPAPGIFYLGATTGDDPGTLTPAQSAAADLQIYGLLRRRYPNAVIVLATLPGVNIPGGVGNAATRQVVNPQRRLLASQNPNTLLFDFEAIYTNPLTGLPIVALSQDQIHPNPGGAQTLGLALAKILAPILGALVGSGVGNGFVNDYFSDTRVQAGQGGWATQAMMIGAGPVGTGWSGNGLAGQVNSLVLRGDQYGSWQQSVYGGTPGAIGIFRAIGAFPAGAVIYAESEAQFQGNLAAGSISDLSLNLTTNLGAACGSSALGNTAGNQGPFIDMGAGVPICLRTPPIQIPVGGITGGFVLPQLSSTAVAGGIRFGRTSLVRVA